MLDTTDILIKTVDFLMEEVKNIRREKNDLIARINMLEHENACKEKDKIIHCNPEDTYREDFGGGAVFKFY